MGSLGEVISFSKEELRKAGIGEMHLKQLQLILRAHDLVLRGPQSHEELTDLNLWDFFEKSKNDK